MAKDKKRELQEKYIEHQMIGQQMKLAHQQVEQAEKQEEELSSVVSSLDDISRTREGTEILVPMASGVFLKAELKDSKELIVNVGAGAAVKKTMPEVRKMLEQQEKELEKFREEMAKQMQKLALRSSEIEDELHKLAKD